jgi:hypothetical protein
MDAEQWGADLEVVEVASPGPVQKGQTLVKFRTDKIDEALAAAERDLTLARFNFQRQTEDLQRQKEAQSLAQKKAEMDFAAADNALTRFLEWEKAMKLQEADLRLQNSKDNLADSEEELAQLEKMYKSDDLTEETEEIVLRRTRRQLARQKTYLTFQQKRDEVWRAVDFPREEESLQLAKRRATVDFERFKVAAATAEEQQRVEYEKAKAGFVKQEETTAKLRKDREKFELKAPEAGIAVWGTLSRGKWSGGEPPSAALIAAGRSKVKPGQVLFTIVRPGDVQVRTSVGEASVFSVIEGLPAKVRPGPAPKLDLVGKISRVGRTSGGTDYDVVIELGAPDARLLPGHTCKVRVTVSEKTDAITVPAACVESDGDKRFVQVWADGKASKREVDAGESSGGRTEILSGLKEGERVLASAPKAKQ